MSAWFDLVADDVVWHEIGGRTLQGKAALEESMSGIEDVELSANLHDVVANDDHAVALVEAHVKAGGEEISYRTGAPTTFRRGRSQSDGRWPRTPRP